MEVYLRKVLTSALDMGSGQPHAPPLYPRGKRPRYPLNRRLVGPRAGMDVLEKRKVSCPCRDFNLGPSSPYLSHLFSKNTNYLGNGLTNVSTTYLEPWLQLKLTSPLCATIGRATGPNTLKYVLPLVAQATKNFYANTVQC